MLSAINCYQGLNSEIPVFVMDFLSSVPRGKRELRIDLAELRLLTSKNLYIGTLCVKCFGALPVVFNLEPQVTGHSKDVTNETFRQLMILQSLQSLGQPRGCEKILPMPSIDFSLESGIPSWDGTKYSKSLGNLCLGKRLTLLSSHMRLSIVMGVPQ